MHVNLTFLLDFKYKGVVSEWGGAAPAPVGREARGWGSPIAPLTAPAP